MNRISIVAGGRHSFMTVRHLVVRGDDIAIGRALADEARMAADWVPAMVDPVVNRARWTWFERNWPQQHARMSGVAAAFGLAPDDDTAALDGIRALPVDPGCSAVWCPPGRSTDGRGRLAGNHDRAVPGGTAVQPYVITTVPDDGLASAVITMSELDGCTEGVNERGLAVILLPGDVTRGAPSPAPRRPQAGLSVTQVPRFLLDTCENVEQATQALLGAKQYDHGVPCHYLVADASGQAFVWERGADGAEHLVQAPGEPLRLTNHPLHRYPRASDLPPGTPETAGTFARFRRLARRTARLPMSPGDLSGALDAVAVPAFADEPSRTLWRTVHDVAARTITARFHLGDGPGGTALLSPELTFHAAG
ncbi:C45 family autoproteolytic acyltransferase/hydolase [Spongiactinospora sp. TRM90649]|uniref:C45 family autoproteolytic acyltransferase/hydolase n=1 Tax=Spongiactinospora sp. TRM90649 TaxID=3031114 RepID=UPI0023F883FC|nr:C45 family autoproteolytic acyltransferase/hydolase [Spongiactinospora sp. TRM90649]MDF5758277.1 C45 family autoproteolytic acyltransferase/hydrolase [Spongiactinospora sp. TRM90649]